MRLPDMIFEPAWLHGDPELDIHLSMPLTASDLVIDELDAIVKNQKDKVAIDLSSRETLTLERSGENIYMTFSNVLLISII